MKKILLISSIILVIVLVLIGLKTQSAYAGEEGYYYFYEEDGCTYKCKCEPYCVYYGTEDAYDYYYRYYRPKKVYIPFKKNYFAIQVGAYRNKVNAYKMQDRMKKLGFATKIFYDGEFYRVITKYAYRYRSAQNKREYLAYNGIRSFLRISE